MPAELKARWVRESRAVGMTLTDWIVGAIEMEARVYDVTLYWHDGGIVFLGTVRADTPDAAEDAALNAYASENERQHKEIEKGGNFQLSADLLLPSEARRWLARKGLLK